MQYLKILDAFSGSGNWVKGWRDSVSFNTEIDSVDILQLPHINYCMDIRDFKITKEYEVVYASFPCTHFCRIKQINKKKTTKEEKDIAVQLADLSFNLAKKAKLAYIIENPATGEATKLYPEFQGIPFKIVDYSEYGFGMRKRTAIWTNLPLNLKIQKEVKYNRISLHTMGKIERSIVPILLSNYIKRIIIRTYNKELQVFKKSGFELF
jgi:hypothetical protein